MIEFHDVQKELEAFKALHYPGNDFPVYFDFTVNFTFSEVNSAFSVLGYSPLKKEFCKLWLCYLYLTLSKKTRVNLSSMINVGKYRVTYPIPSYLPGIVFGGKENSNLRKSAKRSQLLAQGAEIPEELKYKSKAWARKKGLE